MKIIYETYKNSAEQDYIKATFEDGSELFIPNDPANSDYQRYLNPEAEQSTPMIPGDE
jgi:hypothetical protein